MGTLPSCHCYKTTTALDYDPTLLKPPQTQPHSPLPPARVCSLPLKIGCHRVLLSISCQTLLEIEEKNNKKMNNKICTKIVIDKNNIGLKFTRGTVYTLSLCHIRKPTVL